jgi:VanZ family protein
MQLSIIGILLISSGAFGVLFTTAYDFLRPGPADFGRMQFMGFIISVLLLMAGLRSAFHSRRRQLDKIMLCVYLLGMLYLVMIPDSYFSAPNKRLLEITAFLPEDFGVNVLGFFPLGYLLLSLFHSGRGKRLSRYLVVILSGLALSLLIEGVQYFIPGRTSAANDLFANGLGCALGGAWYHFQEPQGGRP